MTQQTVYVVDSKRLPVGKANRGVYRNMRADDLLAYVIRHTIESNSVDANLIEEAIFGCAMPEGSQGMNVARIATLLAGMPDTTPAMTINRFCCSGIESIALLANRIATGEIDCGIAGGIESMSSVPMGGNSLSGNPAFFENDENVGIAYGMGITAEIVAEKYHVDRTMQDEFALESHKRAINAIDQGYFNAEIIPTDVIYRGANLDSMTTTEKKVTVTSDEGPRRDTSMDVLSKLRPAFAKDGSVTAGNSSQVSDGAGCAILVSEAFLKQHNLQPIARFVGYQVAGVPPEVMGIGPIKAIPQVLKKANLTLDDIGWIELNEAFAAQSLAVINELGLDPKKVNPNGGAIALGHPLGATGAIRAATAIHGAKRINEKYAMVTMCIGTGMGAAGIFEVL
ncbi:acetyl-CoA C-acyltransferase [Thiotrichales bacterium 19S3-7]|nr:acetyl-CoA C-acyltransferase [Thiotrichales bacterium 19S3-7]MCF6801028.1 acetyl-CoA C-acyltransferase [Thiotrichales bacterium 19S3-11]